MASHRFDPTIDRIEDIPPVWNARPLEQQPAAPAPAAPQPKPASDQPAKPARSGGLLERIFADDDD